MVISHLILTLSSGYALTKIQYASYPLTHIALVVMCSHGCIHIINRIFCRHDETFELTRISGVLCSYIPLAFINNDLYIDKGLLKHELLYIHSISALVPALLEIFLNGRVSENLKDLLAIAHALSMLYLANMDQNVYFCILAIIWIINRFCLHDIYDGTIFDYQSSISINLALFSLCALKSLKSNELVFDFTD